MKKLILSSSPDRDGILRLREKDYHYLVRVRRLKPGAVFDALLPGNIETKLSVISVNDGVLTVQCMVTHDSIADCAALLTPVYLFQALPKGNKMDLIVRQAAEAGVSHILPFESEYSQVKIALSLDNTQGASTGEKVRRWTRIIREARQQSGSLIPTAVEAPLKLQGLLDYWKKLKKDHESGVGILLHQDPLEQQGTFHDYLKDNPEFTVLAVGPEGGFSSAEAARFLAEGFKPLKMGNTILRTETAALYGVAAIRIILSESAAWGPKFPHSSGNV